MSSSERKLLLRWFNQFSLRSGGIGLFLFACGFLRAFFVQAGLDLFLVTLVVEGEEAVEDGATGGLAEGVALALLGGVEAVIQDQIAP
jgi:hypothetical protein